MSTIREIVAERHRTPVRLNLGELSALLDAALEAGGGDKREQPLHDACRRIGRAEERRRKAVERAMGK